MKKEELFDLLEDVDRKYINEAMFDDIDGDSPAVARPGKAKISPLKIIAPIAACMAVAIGAKFVVSNIGKLSAKPAVNSGALSGKTDGFDLEECKEMLLEHLDASEDEERIWQSNVVDVDNDGSTELLLASGSIDDLPGVYVFAKTDNGVKMIGSFDTEENLCNPQSLLRYNKDYVDFWYYPTYQSSVSENGLIKVSERSLYKIIADDNGISAEQMLSEGVRITEDGKDTYSFDTICGQDVTLKEYYEEWRKYSDSGLDSETLMNSNMTVSDLYPELDISSVPQISTEVLLLEGHHEMALGKAMLCSKTYGDYEVSVVGQYILFDDMHGNDAITIGDMYIVLSKDGIVIDKNNNCPIGDAISQFETYIQLDELDDILTFDEGYGDNIIAHLKFNCDTGRKNLLFKVSDQGIVQVLSYNTD